MTERQVKNLKHGLYRIYWKDGSDSLTAIGSNSKGDRWFAPINWISGVPCYDWSKVLSVVLIHSEPIPKYDLDRRDGR